MHVFTKSTSSTDLQRPLRAIPGPFKKLSKKNSVLRAVGGAAVFIRAEHQQRVQSLQGKPKTKPKKSRQAYYKVNTGSWNQA